MQNRIQKKMVLLCLEKSDSDVRGFLWVLTYRDLTQVMQKICFNAGFVVLLSQHQNNDMKDHNKNIRITVLTL